MVMSKKTTGLPLAIASNTIGSAIVTLMVASQSVGGAALAFVQRSAATACGDLYRAAPSLTALRRCDVCGDVSRRAAYAATRAVGTAWQRLRFTPRNCWCLLTAAARHGKTYLTERRTAERAASRQWRGLGYRHTSESPETLLGATQLTIGVLADWRNGRICHWAIASCGSRTEIRSRAVRQRKNHIGPPREFRPAKDAVEAAKERCSPP